MTSNAQRRDPPRAMRVPRPGGALSLDSLEDSTPEAERDDAPVAFPEDASAIADPPPSVPIADPFAEFEESELRSEATRVEGDENSTFSSVPEAEAAPRIEVIEGPDRGRVYFLQAGDTSVGRGLDNDVILADVGVSRRHLTFHLAGRELLLRDEGSGNGTMVDGTTTHRESPVQNGARIEIGSTTFVVHFPWATQGATLEDAVSAMVAAPSAPSTGELPEPVSEFTPLEGTVVLSRGALIGGALAVASAAALIGAISVALLAPSRPPVIAIQPLPAAPAVDPVALAAAASRPHEEAASTPTAPTLAVVPTPSVDDAGTTPRDDAAPPVLVAEAPAPAVTTAPPSPSPPPAASVEAATAPRTDPPRRRLAAPGPAPGTPTSAVAGVLAAYRAGNFTAAASAARTAAAHAARAQRVSLEQMARSIDGVARRLPEARRGDLVSLREVIRLDRQIAGGDGVLAPELQPRLHTALVTRARRTMSADPTHACQDGREAEGLRETAETRAILRECETRARRVVEEAQRLERSDPSRARTLYAEVTRLVPLSHPSARIAATRTAALAPAPRTAPVRLVRPRDEDE